MKIDFECPGCGKAYLVDRGRAGQVASCDSCQSRFRIPQSMAATAPGSQSQTAPIANQQIMNTFPQQNGNQGGNLPSIPDIHRVGESYATNPGRLKIEATYYIRSYPLWFMVWHGSFLFFALLSLVSFWFLPIALLFGFCTWYYWTRIRAHFKRGATNPSQILSLDPPLLATYTDLTKGGDDVPIILVARQPLSRLSTGPPTVGQRISTVALYQDMFSDSSHWSSFDPKPAACATSTPQQIERNLNSIEKEDWQWLQIGLAQLPTPVREGHFRIYSESDFNQPSLSDPVTIRRRVSVCLQGRRYVHIANEFGGIDAEKLNQTAAFVPADRLNNVWCLIESYQSGIGATNGMAFTNSGVFFEFRSDGKGYLDYCDIVGALSTGSGLEIMMRNRQRIRISQPNLSPDVLANVDVAFNTIGNRTDEWKRFSG